MENNKLTTEMIRKALNNFHESYREGTKNGYTYILPSPNEGRRLLIQGWLSPGEAEQIAKEIWDWKKTVNDYECVKEVDSI